MANPDIKILNKVGCEFCRHEVDHKALGHAIRAEREKMGVGQREVARLMKVSASYVSDLEAGNRNWTAERVNLYIAALRGIV